MIALGFAYTQGGRNEDAIRTLRGLWNSLQTPTLLLGDKEAGLSWFGRAVDLGNHNYPWFSRDRNYDRLRGNPDYERILAEVRRKWERYKALFGS